MAVRYGFYNSVNRDRIYEAGDFSRLFDGVITDGVLPWGSVFALTRVYNGVSVGTGKAWLNGTYTINDTAMTLPVTLGDSTYSRVDRIMLEVNRSTRINRIYISQGTPSADPIASSAIPTSSGSVYQYQLGYMTIAKGATGPANAAAVVRTVGDTIPYSKMPMASRDTPVAMATGLVNATFAGGASLNVQAIYPTGRFTKPPMLMGMLYGGAQWTNIGIRVHGTNSTSGGFLSLYAISGSLPASGTGTIIWYAVQMSDASAEG